MDPKIEKGASLGGDLPERKNSINLIAKAAYNVIWMLFLFIEQSKIMYIF